MKHYLTDVLPKAIIIAGICELVVYSVFFLIHPFDTDYLWGLLFLMIHPALLFTGVLIGGFIAVKYGSTAFFAQYSRLKKWFYFMLPCLLLTASFVFLFDYAMLYLFASQIDNYNNALQDYIISTGDLKQKVIASPLVRQNWQFVQRCIPFIALLSILLVRVKPRL